MVNDHFDRGLMLSGDGPCLTDGRSGHTWRYSQVRELALRIGNALRAEGFGPGRRAAVLATNDVTAYIASLGIMRSGAAWIPLNPRYSAQDNADILARMDCDVLFYLVAFSEAVAHIEKAAPRIARFVCVDGQDRGHPSLLDWCAPHPADEIALPFDLLGVVGIQPTGGTTGQPKGVMLTNQGFDYLVSNYLAIAPSDAPPIYLAAAPLTHAAGFLMQYVFASGGHAIVLPSADPQQMLQAIPRWRITHMTVVPTILYMLLAQPNVRELDYSSLRLVFYGAAPAAPAKLVEAMEVFGPVLMQIFGQTEGMMPITCLSPRDHWPDGVPASPERLRSCGRPVPTCRAIIVDEAGSPLPAGEVGELAIRSAGVMLGYYKDPKGTEAAIRDGWLHTGDLGFMDEQGYVTIVDRIKDMIITGGTNVYSAEVEAAVMADARVADCAAIGLPDDKWGEAVVAVVELRPTCSASAQELIEGCRARLGPIKTPKRIEFVTALPRSAVGKVLKRELRKRFDHG